MISDALSRFLSRQVDLHSAYGPMLTEKIAYNDLLRRFGIKYLVSMSKMVGTRYVWMNCIIIFLKFHILLELGCRYSFNSFLEKRKIPEYLIISKRQETSLTSGHYP